MNKNDVKSFRALLNWDFTSPFLLISLIILFVFIFSNFAVAQTHPLYNQANNYYQQKKFDSAFIVFNQILIEYPNKKEAYYNRGLCLYHLHKYVQATQDFDACLRLDSGFNDAHYMKALALQRNGNIKPALTEFEKTENKNFEQRIKWYQLSVLISKNWYYMVAIMFVIIVLFAVAAKSLDYKKG